MNWGIVRMNVGLVARARMSIDYDGALSSYFTWLPSEQRSKKERSSTAAARCFPLWMDASDLTRGRRRKRRESRVESGWSQSLPALFSFRLLEQSSFAATREGERGQVEKV